MEKFNEWLLASCTAIISIGAWVVKRLFGRIDKLENRVNDVERGLLTRTDLDASLEPIKDTNNLILSHLLEHRGTEHEHRGTKHEPIKTKILKEK